MKSMKIKYNEGGSLLDSSDREEFSAGGKVVHLITKELAKTKNLVEVKLKKL
jgi:hypothetical protein